MVQSCRLCGYPHMTQFLDMGFTPPADQFVRKEMLDKPETHYPLKVVRCDHCRLIQLSYVVPSDILYKNEYPYESSMTSTGKLHFDTFAASVIKSFNVAQGELVVDIGSNVGVLLKGFKDRGCRVLGVDPAENIADIAEKNGIPTISNFFNSEVAVDIASKHGRAKIITATNVFAHIDNLTDLMKAVDTLLMDDGVFIIEAPYLVHLLENLEYDTIYHEHLSYLSLTPLVPFFRNCGFELFDVMQVDIHGGSNRMFISRQDRRKMTQKVHELLTYEEVNGIHSIEYLMKFAEQVRRNKNDLNALLRSLKSGGNKIAAVSAPAKGMTLLNYCKIGNELLEFITEKSILKIDKYAPGNHLLVKHDHALLSENIDYALLLAWNFKDEIMKNLHAFRERGGKFIIPIPKPMVIE